MHKWLMLPLNPSLYSSPKMTLSCRATYWTSGFKWIPWHYFATFWGLCLMEDRWMMYFHFLLCIDFSLTRWIWSNLDGSLVLWLRIFPPSLYPKNTNGLEKQHRSLIVHRLSACFPEVVCPCCFQNLYQPVLGESLSGEEGCVGPQALACPH